jgi:PIN domain nuclease of toxin-antitoxin system
VERGSERAERTNEKEAILSVYLDTHVILWLYEGLLKRFSKTARQAIEQSDLLISPMVRLELQYLHEIKRTTRPAHIILSEMRAQIGVAVCDLPFDQVVRKATEISWTRDPFDRLIVAHASCRNLRLLTKDTRIRRHTNLAFWR